MNLLRLKYIIYSCLIISLRITHTQAQNERFWHLSVEQGLSNATVTAILQDGDGFMWFGTNDGLNKYNGYEIKVYRKSAKDTLGLTSNYINVLAEDPKGNLWVGTNGGLAKYNKNFDTFEKVSELGTGGIIALLIDEKGNTWTGGWNGIKVFDISKQEWQTIKEFNNKYITTIQQSSPNDFWIGVNQQGLFHFHLATKKITQYTHDSAKPQSLSSNSINRILYDKNGSLWITTMNGGINQFDLEKKEFTIFKSNINDQKTILSNTIRGSCKDGNDILFAVENGGMSRYSVEKNTFIHYLHDEKRPRSIAGNSVWTIYKDRQERIWVGMYAKGISIIDKFKDKFNQSPINLPNQTINSVIEDTKGRIWVGTEEGIALYENQTSIHYKHDEKDVESLSANPIMRVFEDANQRIWAGTWQQGANLYIEGKGIFKRYIDKEAQAKGITNKNCVFAFGNYFDNEQVMVGNFGGINILNKNTDQLENFMQYLKQNINIDYVQDIKTDKQKNIWVASLNGLLFLNEKTGSFTTYRSNAKDSTSLASNAIYTIYQDTKNRIWIGTREGLHLLISEGKFKRYNAESGLPNNEINDIVEDSKGNLWITTNQGLSMFDVEKQTFKNYFESDGLLSKQFKTNSIFKTKNGEILLGTINGLNVFYPDSIKNNPHIPPIVFTDFKIFNQSVKIGAKDSILPYHISQSRQITLNHQQSVFSIDFVALNFTQNEKNQYAYQLEGFDKDWNYVGNQRTATYTNLDDGTYIFKVKASNNDGIWNEQGISLKIRILPPWWATWWFRGAIVAFILFSAYSFYKARTNFLKKQNLKLENQVIERTQEIEKKSRELEFANRQIKTKNEELSASEEELRQNMEELETNQEVIEKQRQDLEVAFKSLENTNLRINDSIRYAQRIQQAILPHEDILQKAFIEHFVIYKPKDVVSGDFYWYFEVERKKFLAIVDCTGHGVPGAMMSMMGSSLLKEIVVTKHIHEPANILTELNISIVEAFSKRAERFEDGMDIAICCMEEIGNEQVLVKFSGAKRQIYYFNGQIHEIQGDRYSIGRKHERHFSYQQIDFYLPKNQSSLYFTTDGWIDTIDKNRNRYGSKRLVSLLQQVASLSFDIQREVLLTNLEDYNQDVEQRDDILFVGVKI